MRFITKKDIKLPKRVSESHKGDNGLVLAVGGSKDFAGATALAGLAALRSGCDLVKIIAPEKAAWAINAYSPDLMTVKMKWDYVNSDYCQIVKKEMRKYNVLLIGNGVGLKKESKKACRKIIREIKKLKVIDADAVKSISMGGCENSIITPHSRELEYFLINSKSSTSLRHIELDFLVSKKCIKFLRFKRKRLSPAKTIKSSFIFVLSRINFMSPTAPSFV